MRGPSNPSAGITVERSMQLGARALAVVACLAASGPATTTTATAQPTATAVEARPAKKVIVDRVVAVVNDAIILDSELRSRLVPILADAGAIADPKERARRSQKLTTAALDDMIDEELIVQAAEAAKLEVETAEIDAAVADVQQQHELDDTTFAKALAEEGYTMTTYRTALRRQLLRFRAQKFLVAPKVHVTDDDVRARYDQMQRRSEAVTAVRLSHILIKVPERPTEQQLAEARDRATAVIARVRGGEAFADVAKQASEHAATSATGGELGWFERGSISPEWEQVVFAMDKDEVRGPINGPDGLEVFQVTDIKRTEMRPLPELSAQIKDELSRKQIDKLSTQWIEDLRKQAYIDRKL